MVLEPKNTRPHIIILGAGASLAAFPNGDKNGRKISGMDGFFDNLGYDMNLEFYFGTNHSKNLEEIYIEADEELRGEIEYIIEEHFKRLQLPDDPTIYDQLLLGLRNKDLIATFNWDPFLVQAYIRNRDEFDLPQIVFLHGNIAVRYCPNHYTKIGFTGGLCPICRTKLVVPDLLYPIDKKNYNQTPFLSRQWQILQEHLNISPLVTIFGYSAPSTDIEARNLMLRAWGTPNDRSKEEFEFIDIKPRKKIKEDWEEFIHSHHFRVHNSFYQSFIATHPRRTVEAYNEEILLGKIIDYSSLPFFSTLMELKEYYHPLYDEERENL